jgi:hypothetical protein
VSGKRKVLDAKINGPNQNRKSQGGGEKNTRLKEDK